MRTRALPLLLAAAVLLPTTASAQLRLPVLLQPRFQITASYALPRARAQQTVYQLVPQFTTRQHATDRAGLLGLQQQSLAQMQQTDDGFAVSDGRWDYTLDTERQLETLLDHELMTGQSGRSPVIPAPDQCRELALQFLGSNNLIMGTSYERLRYERTNEILRARVRREDRGRSPSSPRVVLREIVFCKFIGTTPVTGPGSRVSVFIGDGGQVVGFMSNWMPAVPTAERLAVVPPAQAAGLLNTQLAAANRSLPDPQRQLRQVNARACRYALQAFTNNEGRLLLLPVYEFRGEVTDKRNQTLDFTYRVLAPQNLAQVQNTLRLTAPPPVQVPPLQNLKRPTLLKKLLKGGATTPGLPTRAP